MSRYRRLTVLIPILAVLLLASACRASGQGGSATGGEQTIQNKGSDTMVNLALAWAEAYAQRRPDVRVSVTGGGSGTGIAALFNGTVDLANASRALTEEEKATARQNGFEAIEEVVALDAIAVVVHPSNPVDELTIPQLADIFSGRITNWRQVGGEDRPIVLVSRESNSGTYAYFLEQVVRQGRKDSQELFSPRALLMPSSEGISSEVRHNPNAIGYDGLGYVTPDQKVIRVSAGPAAPYVAPSAETVKDGTYPIARPLFVITRGKPSGIVAEYVEWIRGAEGQAIVRELGFVPLQ
ncbi:MAG: phosphate ABC transporter substrate-binding protein [Anaerolineae bacterium]|nr:phosphate ABC transporter substrate-binding protein [Anaerolineae bacterium]